MSFTIHSMQFKKKNNLAIVKKLGFEASKTNYPMS